MADIFEDLESYLISRGVIDVLYKDTIPETPDQMVALLEYAGMTSLPQIGVAQRSFQISCRATSSAKAKQKAWEVYYALQTPTSIVDVVPGRTAMITLRQTPFKMKVDGNRTTYGFNFGLKSNKD